MVRFSSHREVLEQFGTTTFVGYSDDESDARVLAVIERADETVEIFLDVTPFYAESGGKWATLEPWHRHGSNRRRGYDVCPTRVASSSRSI